MEFKDRIYTLKGRSTPLSYTLASRHTQRNALLYFDEKTGTNRALRYSRNQKSPFMDEQDEHAIVEPIVFEDGILRVDKHNTLLNKFLELHPQRGMVFEEVDFERDADSAIDKINYEIDALIAAKSLPIEKMEAICRVALGLNVDRMSSSELKRDVLLYAKQNPREFLEMLDDPDMDLDDHAYQFVNAGLISVRRNGDLWFSLPDNKKKICSTPYGQDPMDVLAAWLMTDEGIEATKTLSAML